MNDQNRDRQNDMDRQAEATKPGASANQAGQRSGTGWPSEQGTGKGSTGDEGMVGHESWQDRTRRGDQEDTETPTTADQGSREQTSRS
jgi:hypothetical protein